MKTKDHKMLSKYLMKQMDCPIDLIGKSAFLLGTVEPDYNPITYLRGSIHQQTMRGHNYDNARNYIKKLIDKLQNPKINEVRKYILLGKLVHYTADAFTYPHNNIFTGNLKEHCIYEEKFHKYFYEKLQYANIMNIPESEENLFHQIEEMHKNYLQEKRDFFSDGIYILSVTSIVFHFFTESEDSKASYCERIIA